MGAVLKILGFVLAAVGLVAWLGGTGFIASEILRETLASDEMPRKIGGIVAVAGLVIALIGSVLVLRVTHNIIPFVICLACGLLAFFGGLKVNPAELANEPMALGIAAAMLAIPAAILLVTRKTIPFLSSVALLGILAAGAMYFVGMPMGAAPPTDSASVGDAALPPVSEQAGEPAPQLAPDTAPPPPAPVTAPPPPAAAQAPPSDMAQAPPAPVTTDQLEPGAGAAREEMAEAAPAPATPRRRGLGGILGGITGGTLARPSPPPPPPPAAAAPMPPAAGPGGEPRSADLAAPSGGGAATASAPPPAAAPVETATAPKPPTADDFGYQDANLKFNKPEDMELGREYTVGATITLPNSVATPATLGDVGPTVTRETKITRKVRVELVGGGSFDVTATNPVTTFLITTNTPGVWNWRVTPRKEGEGRLQLQVFGVLENNGVAEGEVLIKTYEETIPVTVTPMGRVRLISQNVVENWEPVAGALGVIGGIWAFIVNLFAGLRRKREVKA